MLFNFQLRKIADIQPFEEDGEPTLHWFGLTDGWYWVNLGDEVAFKYTQAILEQWGTDATTPYVDYYVVRLWEDLLEMLPYTLNQVDPRLLERLNDMQAWQQWQDKATAWLTSLPEDEEDAAWALYLQATGWWGVRRMDTSYLETAPDLWMWREADNLHIRWRSRGETMDAHTVWATDEAIITMPAEAFIEEVKTFHRMFFNDMKFRVKGAMKNWKYDPIVIDVDDLAAEHAERATWLSRALAMEPTDFTDDWNRVVEAIDAVQEMIGPSG